MGGLHRIASWPRAILAGADGFPLFSLKRLRKIIEGGYCSAWEWRPGYFRSGIRSERATGEIRGRRDGYCEVTAIQRPVAASMHASEFQFDLQEPIFQDLNAAGQRGIQIGLVDFDFSKPYGLNL